MTWGHIGLVVVLWRVDQAYVILQLFHLVWESKLCLEMDNSNVINILEMSLMSLSIKMRRLSGSYKDANRHIWRMYIC